MIASLVATLVILAAPSQETGYVKDQKLAEVTIGPNTPQLPMGAATQYGQYYILRMEGTLGSDQGRQKDAAFVYADPYFGEDLPRRSIAISIIQDGENIYREVPLALSRDKITYNSSHVYELLIEPQASKNFTIAMPESYWDFPRDKPKDYLSKGSLKVTLYSTKIGPVEKDLDFTLLDPYQFHDPNSSLSIRFPLVEPPILGAYNMMGKAKPPREVIGAACDGASLVLLRTVSDKKGKVTFRLAPGDGALYPLVGNPYKTYGSKMLEVESVEDPGDKTGKTHFGFALYRPPSFYRNVPNPQVTVSAEIASENKKSEKTLRLTKPPVVLVHGTYDNPVWCYQTRADDDESPFTMMDRLKRAGFGHVTAVDWEATNGNENPSAFKDNQFSVSRNKGGIRDALKMMRDEGWVSVQADLVCHSQGGVISRVFARGFPLSQPMANDHPHFNDPVACMAANCQYHTPESFGAGSIHRLITISSTHMGSDICRLFDLYEKYTQSEQVSMPSGAWLDIFRFAVHTTSTGLFTGGFADQIPGSSGLKSIGPTPVPSHAIACVSLDEDVVNQYKGFYNDRMGTIYDASPEKAIDWAFRNANQAANADELAKLREEFIDAPDFAKLRRKQDVLLAFRKAVFGNEENDCTVRISSSFGGLGEQHRTRIAGVLHGWAPRYIAVQNRVIELLRDDNTYFDLNGFPDAYDGSRTNMYKATARLDWSDESVARMTAYAPFDVKAAGNPSAGTGTGTGTGTGVNTAGTPESNRLSNEAAALFSKNDMAGAERLYRQAVEADPNSINARLGLTSALFYLNRLPDAEVQAREAIKLDPKNLQAQMNHGNVLSYLGRYAEAEAPYREAIKLKADDHNPWGGLGFIQIMTGKYTDAEKTMREAIRLAPTMANYHALLGNTLGFQAKWNDAEPCYKEAVRLDAKSTIGWLGLGNVEYTRGKYAEAEAMYRKCIGIDGRNGEFHANLAGALYMQGKKDEAANAARTAISLGFKQHWVYKELGLGG